MLISSGAPIPMPRIPSCHVISSCHAPTQPHYPVISLPPSGRSSPFATPAQAKSRAQQSSTHHIGTSPPSCSLSPLHTHTRARTHTHARMHAAGRACATPASCSHQISDGAHLDWLLGGGCGVHAVMRTQSLADGPCPLVVPTHTANFRLSKPTRGIHVAVSCIACIARF